MNAKQRRLVRRAIDREMALEMAYQMGDDEARIPRPARHVRALLNRAPGNRSPRRRSVIWTPREARRQREAFGLRCCECARPAHFIDDNKQPACREHGVWSWF